MRKYLLLLLLLVSGFVTFSQSSFSFSCSKDTFVDCSQNCITLRAVIPDIRSSTTSYTVSPTAPGGSCLYIQANPGATGITTDLVLDDYYSAPIDLPFDFPFYGNVYNQLIAVSNGMLSFDISKQGAITHWQILRDGPGLSSMNGVPENLPSPLYDRAIIMGPYHDLDPSVPGAPLTTQIKYDIVGTAPFRKWIISYNSVPLYGIPTGCNNLFQNTHQMVLYESLGIIEVLIFSKQICTSWNEGRAMIGLQDFAKSAGIMAPGRAASSDPWGTTGMDESWRFVPAAGPTLFKKAELFDLQGNLVSIGDTAGMGNSFLVSFPGVCPVTTTSYIVKSTYRKFNDASIEIYATDTIQVIKTSTAVPISSTIVNAACSPGSTGTVTVTRPVGVSYSYTINGGVSSQASPVFNVSPGTYTVAATNAATGCVSSKDVTVNSASTLTATATVVDAACVGSSTGSITVNAGLGTPGYTYSLNSGPFQISNRFNNLDPAVYVIEVKDAVGCYYNFTETIKEGEGIIAKAVIKNATCAGSPSGSITVLSSNGLAPYTYAINGNMPQPSNVFNLLAGANYTILVTDANACSVSLTAIVENEPGVSASVTVVNAACAGATNGSVIVTPAMGLAPFTYSFNGGLFQLSDTFKNLLPGSYDIIVKDAGNCILDLQAVVGNDPGIIATANISNASCSTTPNGKISVTVTAGVPPFRYSLNGSAFQSSNIFTGLFANSYVIDISDNANCTLRILDTVGNDPKVMAVINAVMPACNGLSSGKISVNASLGIPPYKYSLNAGVYQTGNEFNGITAGTYVVHVQDNNGCILDTTILITQPAPLEVMTVNTISATCSGNADGSITVLATGGTHPYLYTYDSPAGDNYQPTPFFAVTAGNYTVTVKDGNGCRAFTPAVITLLDTMRLNAGPDTTICIGSSVALQPQTNGQTTIFSWTPSIGLSDAFLKNPVAIPVDTITYTLVANWGVCTRSDNIRINILHKPVVFAGEDTAICYKTFAVLNGSATNISGPVSYSWAPLRGLTKADTANTIARPDTTLLYSLTVKDNYGCNFSVTDDIFVTQQPPVPAFAGNDTNAVFSAPHQLMASGGMLYSWSPGGLLTNPFIANPTANLLQDIQFVVTVTDIAGCIGSDTVLVKVFNGPTYYLPKAFSPDGDGLNDIFRPIPVGIQSTDYFRVLNRYGQTLFETSRWMAGWDGTFLGRKQPLGTYVWIVKGKDRNGKTVEMKGTVVIVK